MPNDPLVNSHDLPSVFPINRLGEFAFHLTTILECRDQFLYSHSVSTCSILTM